MALFYLKKNRDSQLMVHVPCSTFLNTVLELYLNQHRAEVLDSGFHCQWSP